VLPITDSVFYFVGSFVQVNYLLMDVTEVATAFSKAIRSIEEQFGCKLRMQAIVDSCPLENQLPLANHLHLLVNHMKLDKVDQPPEAEGPPLE
jgi:hypothetical protein